MASFAERMKAYWLSTDVAPQPGVSAEIIAAFEAQHGVVLPLDVRQYFLTMNGVEDGAWDKHLWYFWPLEELKSAMEEGLPEGLDQPQYCFIFADYSIHAAYLAVRLCPHPDGPSTVFWWCSAWQAVAPSFLEFWQAYMLGDKRVLFP